MLTGCDSLLSTEQSYLLAPLQLCNCIWFTVWTTVLLPLCWNWAEMWKKNEWNENSPVLFKHDTDILHFETYIIIFIKCKSKRQLNSFSYLQTYQYTPAVTCQCHDSPLALVSLFMRFHKSGDGHSRISLDPHMADVASWNVLILGWIRHASRSRQSKASQGQPEKLMTVHLIHKEGVLIF